MDDAAAIAAIGDVPVKPLKALSWSELRKLPLEPPEELFADMVPHPSYSILYAKRGVGKTLTAIAMAYALRSGEDFLAWSVPKPRRVLLVDGEMPAEALRRRFHRLGFHEADDGLFVFLAALDSEGSINLDDPADQESIARFVEEKAIEVVILDNRSALTSGRDENSEQTSILGFITRLRAKGVSVILVSHAGKGGSNRGASRIEDPADLIIKLEGEEADEEAGGAFKLTFEKHRHGPPKPRALNVVIRADAGALELEYSTPEIVAQASKIADRMLKYLSSGPAKQVDIAKALGVQTGSVSKVVKAQIKAGLVRREGGKIALTKAGKAELDNLLALEKSL